MIQDNEQLPATMKKVLQNKLTYNHLDVKILALSFTFLVPTNARTNHTDKTAYDRLECRTKDFKHLAVIYTTIEQANQHYTDDSHHHQRQGKCGDE